MTNLMTVVNIFFSFLVFFYVTFLIKKWRFIQFSWKNNGFFVPLLPFWGTIYLVHFIGRKDNVISALSYMEKIFGYPFNIWLGHDYYYFTKNPVESKAVLHNLSAQNKGTVYRDIAYVFQNSLLTIEYNKWRIRRKEYMKAFKPNSLKVFCLDYYKGSYVLVEDIKSDNGYNKISYELFTKYAFKNFFLTSVRLDEEPKNMHRFGECLMQFQEDVAQKLLDPIMHPAVWLRIHPGGRNTTRNMVEIKSISQNILKEKLKQRTDFKAFVEHEDTPPLLDLMLSMNGTILNDKDIFDDLVFFSAAAADTSGHSLMFCFTLIGMFPEVQEKLYNEVIDTVGDKPILPTDVPDLVYTEAVIHETLRLFPVIPVLARLTSKDIDLGNKILPKGSNVGVSVFHLQRDERYWPDPLKFDPNRFLPENITNIHPFTYIAFSSGPRDCLGKAQAIAMLKISVASIVRNFIISSKHKSIEEFNLMSSLSLKTSHPLDCHFAPRI